MKTKKEIEGIPLTHTDSHLRVNVNVSKLHHLLIVVMLIIPFSISLHSATVTAGAKLFGTPYKICRYADLYLFANGSDPNGTYQWSGPNNFASNQQNPAISNVSFADEGTYYVTFTDSQQQTAYDDFIVEVEECCFESSTPSTYLTGNVSTILSALSGWGMSIEDHVAVNGIVVDQNFSEFQCVQTSGKDIVLFDDIIGYTIYVEGGNEIQIGCSHLHGCDGYVDICIYLEPNSLLSAGGDTFEDATWMIWAEGYSGVKVWDSHFHANGVALEIPPPDDQSIQYIDPWEFSGNEIDCENDVFLGSSCKSYAGIDAYNLEYLSIDPDYTNSFHDMLNGIVIHDCYVSVSNCTFSDILTWGTNYP